MHCVERNLHKYYNTCNKTIYNKRKESLIKTDSSQSQRVYVTFIYSAYRISIRKSDLLRCQRSNNILFYIYWCCDIYCWRGNLSVQKMWHLLLLVRTIYFIVGEQDVPSVPYRKKSATPMERQLKFKQQGRKFGMTFFVSDVDWFCVSFSLCLIKFFVKTKTNVD